MMIGLVHDSYCHWERGHRFLEAIEVDLTIGLIHDSYRRWERGRRFFAMDEDIMLSRSG
jgi:hypothetical protein